MSSLPGPCYPVPLCALLGFYPTNKHVDSETRNPITTFFYVFVCLVDRPSLYNLFQMKPTRCTLLPSIFISTSLHVSGNYVPLITRTYCIYATLVFTECSVHLVGFI